MVVIQGTKNSKLVGQVLRGFILLILIYGARGDCPDGETIHPCLCRDKSNGDIAEVTCSGNVGLVKLTTILRNNLCGKVIEQFKLLYSDVQYLPSNLFYKVALKDIQVSSTYISHFTRAGRSAFYGLEDVLGSLSMRRCHLVDALQWQKVAEMRALTYLDLSYNSLTRVPLEWFEQPPPNLLSLILKGNRISSIEKGAFASMHTLIELDLSENGITVMNRDVFPTLGNALIFLRLNENELTNLPFDMFDEMMGLRRIYLDGNKIEKLPKEVWLTIWGDLGRLDLNGNPLSCDCDMSWIADFKPPEHIYGECKFSNRTSIMLRDLETTHFVFCNNTNTDSSPIHF